MKGEGRQEAGERQHAQGVGERGIKCAVHRRQCAEKAGDGKGEWKVNVCRGEPCVRPNRNEQEEKKGDRRIPEK
jgi:hypothetical protein